MKPDTIGFREQNDKKRDRLIKTTKIIFVTQKHIFFETQTNLTTRIDKENIGQLTLRIYLH
jgi:hypothetical protein